jgi:hypothetical protein
VSRWKLWIRNSTDICIQANQAGNPPDERIESSWPWLILRSINVLLRKSIIRLRRPHITQGILEPSCTDVMRGIESGDIGLDIQ